MTTKSSCCGAEIIENEWSIYDGEREATQWRCAKCIEICNPISLDCYCKKEALEWINKINSMIFDNQFAETGLLSYAANYPKFFQEFKKFLKSIPLLLGEK